MSRNYRMPFMLWIAAWTLFMLAVLALIVTVIGWLVIPVEPQREAGKGQQETFSEGAGLSVVGESEITHPRSR